MQRTMVSRWTRRLTLPLLAACASCTTVSVDGPQQRLCSRYTDLFLEETKHADAPGTSQASHANFELAEAGQLNLSNRDKALAKQVLHLCEQEGVEASARARRTLAPWWRRIIG